MNKAVLFFISLTLLCYSFTQDYILKKEFQKAPLFENQMIFKGDRLPFEGLDILIFSNIESNNGCKNGTVWLSFDGGKSWPVKKLVEKDGFRYSSLAVGRKNTPSEGYIYLLYETGTKENINDYGGGMVARFNLSWLMEGNNINQILKQSHEV